MDDTLFLHDNEKLLCSMRPSHALFIRSLLQGVIETAATGTLIAMILVIGWWFAAATLPPVWVYPIVYIVILLFIVRRRWKLWGKCLFRVTTDRIFFVKPKSLVSNTSKTIKWAQYQESSNARANVLEFLFHVRPLCIRYGNLDAHDIACFPALPYAVDIKHYLDKVDSAVKNKQIDTLNAFIAKPKGQRY